MIDLTPLDVRKKKGDFRKKPLGGYETAEVDNFLELVEDRLEELVRENLSLTDRLAAAEARLGTLEGREEAVQEALVSAQKLRKEVQDQTLKDVEVLEDRSRREIELLTKEAHTEIQRRFMEAESFLRERQQALEDLERNRRKFLKSFRNLLERELDAVEVEEARRPLEDAPVELEFRGWRGPDFDPSEEGEEGSGEEDGGGGRYGQEPLWLSSLLKQEDDDAPTDHDSQEVEEAEESQEGVEATLFLVEAPDRGEDEESGGEPEGEGEKEAGDGEEDQVDEEDEKEG